MLWVHRVIRRGALLCQHFPQMPKQAEAGDIRAGVNRLAMGLELIQQSVLTAGHLLEHRVQGLWPWQASAMAAANSTPVPRGRLNSSTSPWAIPPFPRGKRCDR